MASILIEKVREHEVIYNHRLPNYRDQHVRQAAWDDIGKKLQISGTKAKENWDKLRRCFCNARNRRREDIKNNTGHKQKAPWKYEQQMSFILPFLESRRTHGKLKDSKDSIVKLAIREDDLSEVSEAEQITTRQSKRGRKRAAQESQCTDEKPILVETKVEVVNPIKTNKRKEPIETSSLEDIQYEKTSPQKHDKTISILETLDDTDMFFLSMSRMTKKLGRVEQANIKLELGHSVLSAELRCNQR